MSSPLIVTQGASLKPVHTTKAARQVDYGQHKQRWTPDPEDFAPQDASSACREEHANPDRGNRNRPPGKEEALCVKGREKGHAQAAIGHGVQHAMRGGNQKEQNRKSPSQVKSSVQKKRQESGYKERKQEGMSHAPVAPECPIGHSHLKA